VARRGRYTVRFAASVAADYREFDMPAVLLRECRKRGIAVHAWFWIFAEGGGSPVVQQHPEWLALSPRRTGTSTRGR
jgi:uncharacterized lipoprotein YddW (UPF0748 family)